MKPTNSPTQGQPNPRKIRVKIAFGEAWLHLTISMQPLLLFSYSSSNTTAFGPLLPRVGIGFAPSIYKIYVGNRLQFSANTLYYIITSWFQQEAEKFGFELYV